MANLVTYRSPSIVRHNDGSYRVFAEEDLGRGFVADVWIDLDATLNETDSSYKRHSKPEKELARFARNLIAKLPAPGSDEDKSEGFVEITVHRKFRRAVEENDYEGLSKFEVGKLNTLLAEKGVSFSDPAYIAPSPHAGPCDATGNHCDKAFRVRVGYRK